MNKYAFYDFKLGILKIAYTTNYITLLKKVTQIDALDEHSKLSDLAFSEMQEYFKGQRKNFSFPFEFRGTDFQNKVWKALCDIPYGQTRSYKDIAIAIGNVKACRAVGMANNKNPISIAVPWHRVIGASGQLVGYAGGLDMKMALLELEKTYQST